VPAVRDAGSVSELGVGAGLGAGFMGAGGRGGRGVQGCRHAAGGAPVVRGWPSRELQPAPTLESLGLWHIRSQLAPKSRICSCLAPRLAAARAHQGCRDCWVARHRARFEAAPPHLRHLWQQRPVPQLNRQQRQWRVKRSKTRLKTLRGLRLVAARPTGLYPCGAVRWAPYRSLKLHTHRPRLTTPSVRCKESWVGRWPGKRHAMCEDARPTAWRRPPPAAPSCPATGKRSGRTRTRQRST
jgi:hypothetical protein